MNVRQRLNNLILIFLPVLAMVPCNTAAWTLLSTPLPPYTMEEKPYGLMIELIEHLAEGMDEELEVQMPPWARAQRMVQNEGNFLIGPLTRTELRENNYDWLIPITDYQLVFVTNKPYLDISTPEKLRQHQVCALRESPASQNLSSLQIDNVVLFNDDIKCMQLLTLGRVKVTFTHGRSMAIWGYAIAGRDPAELRFGYSFKGGTLYLASTKGMFSEEQKKRLSERFNHARTSGYFQQLLDKYETPPSFRYRHKEFGEDLILP